MKYRGLKVLSLSVMVFLAITSAAHMRGVGQTSAPQRDSVLERLDGVWQGEGKTLGMNAHMRMHWEWVLGKKFLRLSLLNEMTPPSGPTQIFEGQAYYRSLGEAKFEATWFDSRGLTFPIKAAADGNALIAFWGSAETEQGKSTYRILEPNKLEVIDEVRQKDGSFKPFGRFILQRQ